MTHSVPNSVPSAWFSVLGLSGTAAYGWLHQYHWEETDMAKKTIADGPVLAALREMGYRPSDRFFESNGGMKSSYWLRDPQGRERRIKIQKSGPPTGEGRGDRHRHRFGIAFQAFDAVDDFVFWAKDEAILYIVPTTLLREVYRTPGELPKILKGVQWEAHIYFDDDRRQLVPTGYGAPTPLEGYARTIPPRVTADA
jgi:hypothetical protein